MVYAIRYNEAMSSKQGLYVQCLVLPCTDAKQPPKGIWDARMEAVGCKGTGAQVDFVEPESWIENHLLSGA